VTRPLRKPRPFRYRMDSWIRGIAIRIIGWLAPRQPNVELDPRDPSVRRILLVRVNFRMGNAILTLPAIDAFRKTFPDAKIDFLGSPISSLLFRHHQPLNQHYVAPRRFPQVVWQNPLLIRRLRANRYDLAVDVSCSHSGAAAFVIGLSGARIRAGVAGKGDQVFNLKVAKLRERNKYRKLSEFLRALKLDRINPVGAIQFSKEEKEEARVRLESLAARKRDKVAGVFVGGRKLRGKGWPRESFLQAITGLRQSGIKVIVFLGPEEKGMVDFFKSSLAPDVPLVFEPAVRKFAALVAHIDLLICCDSGPMHLACATGARVVALFQPRDVNRWAPPPSAARVLVDATPAQVLAAAFEELSCLKPAGSPPLKSAEITVNP
jgi:heptosyltransferase III